MCDIKIGDMVRCKVGFNKSTAGQGYYPNRVFVVGGISDSIFGHVIWPSFNWNTDMNEDRRNQHNGVWHVYLEIVGDDININKTVEQFKFL